MEVGIGDNNQWLDFGVWRWFDLHPEHRKALKKFDCRPYDNNYYTIRLYLNMVIW